MGINDGINRIAGKVEEAKAKIIEKGGQVTSTSINDLPQEIASIPNMGSSLEILDFGRIDSSQGNIPVPEEISEKIKSNPTNYALSFIDEAVLEKLRFYVYCVSSTNEGVIVYSNTSSTLISNILYMVIITPDTHSAVFSAMKIPGAIYGNSYSNNSLLQWVQGDWKIEESNGLYSKQSFRTMAVGSALPNNIDDIPQGALYGVF